MKKTLAAVLLSAMLLSGVPAMAFAHEGVNVNVSATSSSVQSLIDQINALLRQVNDLQGQIKSLKGEIRTVAKEEHKNDNKP